MDMRARGMAAGALVLSLAALWCSREPVRRQAATLRNARLAHAAALRSCEEVSAVKGFLQEWAFGGESGLRKLRVVRGGEIEERATQASPVQGKAAE